MRPQLTPLPEDISGLAALAEEQLEDLGWNDMGADADADQAEAPLLSTKPATKITDNPLATTSGEVQAASEAAGRTPGSSGLSAAASADVVPLRRTVSSRAHANTAANEDSLETAAPRVETTVAVSAKPARKPTKASKPRAPKSGRRAAFTLRLDPDRHLKLRLAATMQGVSAQSLVTQALDALFEDHKALDTLVERMKRT